MSCLLAKVIIPGVTQTKPRARHLRVDGAQSETQSACDRLLKIKANCVPDI